MSSLDLELGSTPDGRFRLEARLGGGDTRAVFEAVDEDRGSPCALEVFTADALPVDRRADLEQHIEELRSIAHPQVVVPYHAGTLEGGDLFFTASTWLNGADLGAITRHSGPVPPEQVCTWVESMSAALGAVHAAGHRHGQLAPSSLFLARDDAGKPIMMVLDTEKQGLVERASASPFEAGPFAKTEPEDGAAVDVHALGHIVHALLGGDDAEATQGEAFRSWHAKATAAAVADRYPSVGEAATLLALALNVRRDAQGELRQVVGSDGRAELGETLRPEDLKEAAAAAKTAAGKTAIDPLGDTHGADELSAAADAAIAEAKRDGVAVPVAHIADTVDMEDDERDALLTEALPVQSSSATGIVVAVIAVAVLIAISVLATR